MVFLKSLHLHIVLFILFTTMTSSKRAPRRNQSRNQLRDFQSEGEEDPDQGVCQLEVTCKSDDQGQPISLPIRGPRGPPGKPGIPGLPGSRGLPGAPGLALSSSKDCQVAFFVGLGKNAGPVKENTDLMFDRIITNVGETFDPATSRFTAPYNGTYNFFVTIAAQGRTRAAVELRKNGQMIMTVWAESIPYWASASNQALLSLVTGDQVWLVLLSRACYPHGYMYTTFSGHCLHRSL